MDWTAFLLSLRLAAWTLAILLPVGLLVARALAHARFAGKPLVEAALALPLVLPPTVLGYYLLVAFGGESALGRLYETAFGRPLVFTFQGLLLASVIFNLPFAIQPIQRAFGHRPRDPRGRRVLRAQALAHLLAHRAAARLAGAGHRPGALVRAHPGRVRRRAHGRRQHPRRDAHRGHRDL